MKNDLFTDKNRFLSTLGLIGVVIGGVWYITKNNKKEISNRKLDNEEIKNLLVSISNELHPILMEFSNLVSSINIPIDINSIEFSNYSEIIFSNGGFKDKIVRAQKEVIDNLAIDQENFEKLLYSACKVDEEVLMLKLGIDRMYEDSFKGVYPLLPYFGLKADFSKKYPNFTQDHVLRRLRELNNEKEKGLKAVVKELDGLSRHVKEHPISGVIPSEKLSKRLEEINKQSENTVFESIESKRLFSHAIALYSREVEFAEKKRILEREHCDNILNIILNYK
ncbi:hypothetical protein [Cryptosporidium parvum Iowa II]|uniref:Uncharacterized protein n=2 Tax=Cryptosporidium parvum TaxID=5807 RepID=Q5CYE1_CRYPI|nr:hypothetical protein [Cryptosporidium parvum Iowa II]EAK90286.1 conserved hypothetical protein [Cryptosporidium parvum Iowa II]QOY40587.1 Uncharacterized protein CPATCC_0008500 [Cryptosporidium parvum]WKS78957.1 hypothetical protein CPCDC_7g2690 [Cryptosporidium sp. 43IA8]WRK33442.1 Uncharacterized protein cpbgf_7002690 [Cryptosporidium parvum]|eukprot:QOY40587.1 hypothetical protein CPATCC_003459 [Cryptosporidium parvum]